MCSLAGGLGMRTLLLALLATSVSSLSPVLPSDAGVSRRLGECWQPHSRLLLRGGGACFSCMVSVCSEHIRAFSLLGTRRVSRSRVPGKAIPLSRSR